MTAAAVTAITNFILACEVFFLGGRMVEAPKERFSPAWYWSGMMVLLGLAALLGGIDHGFFEQAGLSREVIQRSNWIVLGMMTFFLLMTTASQFFPPQVRFFFLVFGIIQIIANAVAVFLVDSFLVVILNYAPVMMLLLFMNLLNLKSGLGSGSMAVGILIQFAAAGIQASGMDVFTPLNHNGVYHLVSMVGIVYLYRGGQVLRTRREFKRYLRTRVF